MHRVECRGRGRELALDLLRAPAEKAISARQRWSWPSHRVSFHLSLMASARCALFRAWARSPAQSSIHADSRHTKPRKLSFGWASRMLRARAMESPAWA
ncbi:MAG: hypothetical protein U0166_10505 [Acidobacteriota bacterium]